VDAGAILSYVGLGIAGILAGSIVWAAIEEWRQESSRRKEQNALEAQMRADLRELIKEVEKR
jgi:hypothetical protein